MPIRYLSGLSVDSTVLVVDTVNDRVGIGTASPAYKLDVDGGSATTVARFYNSGITSTIIQLGDTGNSQYSEFIWNADTSVASIFKAGTAFSGYGGANSFNIYNQTGPIAFHPNNISNAMFIATTGNVGIGTTSPSYKLEVNGNVYGSTTAQFGTGYIDGTQAGWAIFGSNSSSNGIKIVLDGSVLRNDIVVATSGNVGIGTASPSQKLQVSGSIALNTATDGTSRYYTYPDVNHSWYYDDNIVGSSADVMTYYENFLVRHQDTTNVFLINGSGNVGIGTTSPSAKLEVNVGLNSLKISGRNTYVDSSEDATNANIYVTQDGVGDFGQLAGNLVLQARTQGTVYRDIIFAGGLSNGDALMTILGEGNVGIGTTAPGYKLQVYNSSNGTTAAFGGTAYGVRIDNGGTFSSGRSTIYGVDNTFYGSYQPLCIGASTLAFSISGTDKVTIDTAGNVGIGTTSPSDTLDLYQAANTTAIRLTSAGVGSKIYRLTSQLIGVSNAGFGIQNATDGRYELAIDGSGNVGIGTTAPFSKLTVSGALTSSASQISIVNTEGGHAIIRSGIAGVSNNGISFITAAVDGTSQVNNMVIDAAGEVGIGTTQPMGPLEVYKSTTGGLGGHIILNNNGLAVGNETAILFGDSGVGSASSIRAAISSTVEGAPYRGDIKFKTGVTTYGGLSTSMIITGAGNVGIGTTSPAQKLDVVGDGIRTSADQSTSAFLVLAGSASEGRITVSSYGGYQPMTFYTGGSERMRITSTGNVGIGTTAPTEILNISRVSTNNYIKVEAGGQAANYSGLMLTEYGINWGWALRHNAATDLLHISYQDNTPTFSDTVTFNRNGNVGIGTTAPSSLLSLSKSGLVDFQLNASDQATDEKTWVWQAGAPVGAGVYRLRAVNDAYTNGVNAVTFTRSGISSVTATFSSSVEATSFIKTSGTSSQYLMADGSVSTLTNPVTGTGTTNYVPKFTSSSAIGNSQIFDTGSFVTIGSTTNDGNGLTVNDVSNYRGIGIATSTASARPTLSFINRNTAQYGSFIQDINGALALGRMNFDYGGHSEFVRIANDGNVGIGTTGPTYKLHVVGGPLGVNIGTASTNQAAAQFVDSARGLTYMPTVAGGAYNWASVTDGSALFNTTGSDWWVGNHDGSALRFVQNSSLVFYTNSGAQGIWNSTGLGIGTTAPSGKLHVLNSAVGGTYYGQLIVEQNGEAAINIKGVSYSSIYFADAANPVESGIVYDHSTNTLEFRRSGNVNALTLAPTGAATFSSSGLFSSNLQTNGVLTIGNQSVAGNYFLQITPSTTVPVALQGVLAGTGPAPISLQTGGGNVLIGTTTDAGYKLAVNGSAGLALSSGGIVVASYDGNTGNIKPSVANGSVLISDDSGTTGRGTEFLNNGGLIASSTQSVVASFNSSVTDGIGWIQVNTTQQTTASGTSPAAIELVGLRGTSTHGRHAFIGAEGVDGTTYRTQIKFKIRPEDSPYQWSTLPTQMVIDGNGRVGINNAAPDYNLDVYAMDTPVVRIQSQNSGGVGNPRLLMSRGGEDTFQINVEPNVGVNLKAVVANAGYMDFYTGTDAVTMRVSSSKNLLIGTTTDSGYRLRVNGTSYFDGLAHFAQTATTGSAFRWGSFGTAVSPDTMLCMNQLWNGSGWTILDANYGTTAINLGSAAASPTMQFQTGGANTSATTKMIILNNGDVGIGTTAPSRRLYVVSSDDTRGIMVEQTLASSYAEVHFKANREYRIGTGGSTSAAEAANNWYVYDATAAAQRFVITSTGNVGIGTTGPTEKLHVDGSTLITYNNSFQSTNSVGNKAILARVSPTAGIINYAEYATAANLNGFVIGSDDARVKGNITGDSLEFITNTSTRMTILSGGNVGINTTTPGSTLHVIGDVLIQTGALGVGVNPNATDGRIDASNDIVAFSTSDRRLKENITPIANALEKVRSLTGVEFDWKEETKSVHGYEGHDVGVIAQDVQAVLPEAVRTNDSGYLSVRYEKMIALLVEANKELADRVEQLEKLIK